jgi:hypothetical protein
MDKLLLTGSKPPPPWASAPSKLYELLQTGPPPSVRIGTCRRVPAEPLHRFSPNLRTTDPLETLSGRS